MGDAKNPEPNGLVAQLIAYSAVLGAAWTALWTFALTVVLLAAGLTVVWVAQKSFEIKGDSLYVALLLVPVVVYLLVTGKLGELKLPGGVTLKAMKTELEAVRKDVADVGELEPERSTYLGKLRQVQAKDGTDFCLIYADVVGLRAHTREVYLRQQEADQDRSRRRTEKEIREEVIRSLGIALTDAFYQIIPVAESRRAKHDLFFLEDPDVAMIVRKVSRAKAQEIAEEGGKRIGADRNGPAKVVVQPALSNKSTRELDGEAAKQLAEKS